MTIPRALLITAASFLMTACAAPEQGEAPLHDVPAAHATVQSQTDFDSTVARLEQAIMERSLTLFQVVDHGAGARSVGKPMGHSKLFIFGNPKVGTTFMQADPLFGLDLPLKALVYEQDGVVHVATPNIDAIALRHGIDGLEELRTKVRGALSAIAAEAAL